MKKELLAIFVILTYSISTFSQNEIDALRYSQDYQLGSGKHAAMSGAFGALGGEFSGLATNPAGIGMYQYNEFSLTPTFNLNTTSSYFGSKETDFSSGLKIGNFGLVFSSLKKDSEWKRINFAIGWIQQANYNNNLRISGINNNSSLADNILDLAEGNTIDNLDALSWGAFMTDLIDLSDYRIDTTTGLLQGINNGNYKSNISSNSPKLQTYNSYSIGGKNEFILSIGSSFKEKVYIGLTIGLPTINYYERSSYSEEEFRDTINGLERFDLQQDINVYGSGINLKFGTIIRLSETLKLGAALHTPTAYSIDETFSSTISTHFSEEIYTDKSGPYFIEYNLITPWKAIISASSLVNKRILLSADYEIIDYTFPKIYSNYYSFDNENTTIEEIYAKTANIRLGSEINIKPFALRTGYSKYGSEFTSKNYSSESYSFGLGLNNKGYYFDIAYVLIQRNGETQLYSKENVNPTPLVNTNHNLIITFGFRY